MVLSHCLNLGLSLRLRPNWNWWSTDVTCKKSLSISSGNWVRSGRIPDEDVGLLSAISSFSRLSSYCGIRGPLLLGSVAVSWMGSSARSSAVRSRKQTRGTTDNQPPSAMRKHKMAGGFSAAGASCRGSTLLLCFLLSFLVTFFILFGFTFRSSRLSPPEKFEDSAIGGFSNDENHASEDRRRRTEQIGSGIRVYGYEIVREFDHDPRAFTQGLLYSGNGTLYESTGLYGQSTVREVDLLTGKVRRTRRMNKGEFGEGLTLWKDRLYQVTWRNQKIFIYDQKTLAPRGEATHHMKDGWGLTTSDEYIIGSDGTSKLYFMKPETFEDVNVLTVKDGDKQVGWLNELEFINGEVWANIWQAECIARISPKNGKVTGWVVLQGLRSSLIARGAENLNVLNGIAWDKEENKLYVTGKMWPKVFQIRVVEKTTDDEELLRRMLFVVNLSFGRFGATQLAREKFGLCGADVVLSGNTVRRRIY
ncbi:hypothetical protein R1flu_024821 [Riccia fluitans]|uniref:Glutamine cyclotransferase n=1 Tax=Riccia fluitans TaxID=41844 RepID=A0ABD1XW02_9MARC